MPQIAQKLVNPLVSVVVITYNSAQYVLETLESIKAQTYKNIELIISDDFSRDRTLAVCENWIEENKKFFVRTNIVKTKKNTGTSINLNRGITVTSGEWIKIIAGDDALYPEIIEKYIDYIRSNPQTEFLHSKVVHFTETFEEENKVEREDSKYFKINQADIGPEKQFQILLRSCLIGAPTVMIKKSVFDQIGLFSEEYPLWEDRPMWLKLTKAGIKLEYLDFKGAKYRERENSVARIKTKALLSNFYINKNKILYNKYLNEYPFYERLLISALYLNISVFTKLNLNNNSSKSKVLYNLFVLPLNFLSSRIEKNYQ